MSVEFNEEQRLIVNDPNKVSFLNNFLIQKGFAKEEKQANIILIIMIVVLLLMTFFVTYFFIFDKTLNTNSFNNENTKIIKEYRDQGLQGSELIRKIQEARRNGIIK